MLAKLLSEKHIQIIDQIQDWEAAIALAAKPLLAEGLIEESYIEAMIGALKKHGPYIVLGDYFALPHAQGGSGVNQLSMALLNVGQEVDLLGKPVKSFLVLASRDNTEHMEALMSLSNLLMDEANLKKFVHGNKEEVLELINQ